MATINSMETELKPINDKYRYSLSQERIEHVSDLIGSWGPLQKRLFFLLGVIYCASPYNNASLFYYALKSDLVCVQSDGSQISIAADKCSFDQLNSCSSWYHNITRTTVTKEWNLVCERYWLRSVVLSAYQVGYMISGLLVGCISDKLGRKFAILFCICLEIITSFGLVLAPNVYVFIAIRVIHGIGGYGRFLASLILLLESVGPKLRGRIVVSYDWIWFVGEVVMLFVTYNILEFRYIYMGSMVFQIMCIGVLMFVPESARWQLVVGKVDSAKKTLRYYAKKRESKKRLKLQAEKVEVDEIDEYENVLFARKLDKLREYLISETESKDQMGIFDLFRVPKIAKFCFALYLIWFLTAFIGFGLAYSTLDLSGNVFINNGIFMTSSFASNLFMTWKVDSFKRKSMLIVMFLGTSVLLCASIAFVESHDYIIPRMILITSGRFTASSLFSLIYIYTSEVFPTNIRHLGVGTCSVAARMASISAPFLAQLTAITSLKLTFGLFSIMGLIGASAAILLPETKGKEIPDTVEGMIDMHSNEIE
ncbi:organic cation transporter protein-like [Panonychus citri]|uniref:organic cation transporter protein-like n=1 Tax=Panonychus citri TaxID=50023 RepID=UPI002307284D|nr:organic cation transporter protein-like [Panonychus citri]